MIYLRIPFSCFFQVLYHSINAGVRGTCLPTGVRGRSPCKWDVSPDGGRGRSPCKWDVSPDGGVGAAPLQMGRVPPIRPQGRRLFNAPLRLSAPYYSAAYPRTRIARRISHKIVGRGVDYDSPADYLRNGEALGVYRAESKSVV